MLDILIRAGCFVAINSFSVVLSILFMVTLLRIIL